MASAAYACDAISCGDAYALKDGFTKVPEPLKMFLMSSSCHDKGCDVELPVVVDLLLPTSALRLFDVAGSFHLRIRIED